MENSHEAFERGGDRWDSPQDRADPIVQALREFVDRTERYQYGYAEGPLKPVKHGRDFGRKQAYERTKTLGLIERSHWESLNRRVQEPAPLPHHLLTEVRAPKQGDCWDMDEIEKNIQRLQRDHERAKRELLGK